MNDNQQNQEELLNDENKSTSGKETQRQHAENASQNNDEADRFDLDSLKGDVHNDRKGEADDVK